MRYFHVRGHEVGELSSEVTTNLNDVIFLPGVGTFGQGMRYLKHHSLTEVLNRHFKEGGIMIGICLGMQLMLKGSDESPEVEGLGLIPGKCKKISASKAFTVPHLGWNSIIKNRDFKSTSENKIFNKDGHSISDYYFVHSYFCMLEDNRSVIGFSKHPNENIAAVFKMNNAYGMQFHPEKSGKSGYKLLDLILKGEV